MDYTELLTSKDFHSPLLRGNNGILCLKRLSYVAVFLVLLLIIVLFFFPTFFSYLDEPDVSHCLDIKPYFEDKFCSLSLVESIPLNLTYTTPIQTITTYDAWKQLILNATKVIEIASFYWSLRGSDVYKDPTDWQGEEIFKLLFDAVNIRKIKLTIIENQLNDLDNETQLLKNAGASIKSINFTKMLNSGVLHTKLLIFDEASFYIGSANMDWRSLTQVKELGLMAVNCPSITSDIQKIFEVYNYLGDHDSKLPYWWSHSLQTCFNLNYPMHLKLDEIATNIYISSAPPALNPKGRTSDVDAILQIIASARKFINIAVMDYSPSIEYASPRIYWPVIDDALRKAAIQNSVHISILVSWWKHTKPDMINYLNSLFALNGIREHTNISIKLFCLPAYTKSQSMIPFARVNHNKYMVTESTAYIGTSNWSGDYFTSTAGIGFIVNQTSLDNQTIQAQLHEIFKRDFQSEYSIELKDLHAGYSCDRFEKQ